MADNSTGLSDTLRQMVDGREPQKNNVNPFAETTVTQSTVAPQKNGNGGTLIDDEAGDVLGVVSKPQQNATGQGYQSVVRPLSASRRNDGLKKLLIPICAVVGTLLLYPAIWAVVELLDEESNYAGLAWVMMTAWPISLLLLAGAVLLFWQVKK